MPTVHIKNECPVRESFRVQQVAGLFDVPLGKKCTVEFSVEVPGLDEAWQIGAIVGPSGSGKSSVARTVFGEHLYTQGPWRTDRSVVDAFPEAMSIREVTQALIAVGFSSPPAWARPYHVLSNGEKFRCDLAYGLLCASHIETSKGRKVEKSKRRNTGETPVPHREKSTGETPVPHGGPRDRLVVFDEFTSVVDRTVAKIGSAAVAKYLRRGAEDKTACGGTTRFVAVTCHYDVLEWLQPDWVLDMATGKLARGRLQRGRPEIRLELFRCEREAWALFARHHYLSANLHRAAQCYLSTWDRQPVGFTAVLPLAGFKGVFREHRTVVLPDYQGVGIGSRQAELVGDLYLGRRLRYVSTSSHPGVIAHRKRSPLWRLRAVKKLGGSPHGDEQSHIVTSQGRAVVSFEYVGERRSEWAAKTPRRQGKRQEERTKENAMSNDKPWAYNAARYSWMIPNITIAARQKGYAIGLHGSMHNDLDLIAVPWTPEAAPEEELVEAIRECVEGNVPMLFRADGGIVPNPENKPHGRRAYVIRLNNEGAFIDLSVMPRV